MSKRIDEAGSRDITDLDFVTEVRPGFLQVDRERLKAFLAARGIDPTDDTRLKTCGIVNTGFVVDQEMYDDDSRYWRSSDDPRDESGGSHGDCEMPRP